MTTMTMTTMRVDRSREGRESVWDQTWVEQSVSLRDFGFVQNLSALLRLAAGSRSRVSRVYFFAGANWIVARRLPIVEYCPTCMTESKSKNEINQNRMIRQTNIPCGTWRRRSRSSGRGRRQHTRRRRATPAHGLAPAPPARRRRRRRPRPRRAGLALALVRRRLLHGHDVPAAADALVERADQLLAALEHGARLGDDLAAPPVVEQQAGAAVAGAASASASRAASRRANSPRSSPPGAKNQNDRPAASRAACCAAVKLRGFSCTRVSKMSPAALLPLALMLLAVPNAEDEEGRPAGGCGGGSRSPGPARRARCAAGARRRDGWVEDAGVR